MTRVVAIADLHGNLPDDLPEGDVLVIAGDVCPITDHEINFQERWLSEVFPEWLDVPPPPRVVWIAGNHDFVCQRPGWKPDRPRPLPARRAAPRSPACSFYGTPWVPKLRGLGLLRDRRAAGRAYGGDPARRRPHLARPAPRLRRPARARRPRRLAGAADRLDEVPPQVCVFGHIHEDHGAGSRGSRELANVAHVDIRYRGAAERRRRLFEPLAAAPTRTAAPP